MAGKSAAAQDGLRHTGKSPEKTGRPYILWDTQVEGPPVAIGLQAPVMTAGGKQWQTWPMPALKPGTPITQANMPTVKALTAKKGHIVAASGATVARGTPEAALSDHTRQAIRNAAWTALGQFLGVEQ